MQDSPYPAKIRSESSLCNPILVRVIWSRRLRLQSELFVGFLELCAGGDPIIILNSSMAQRSCWTSLCLYDISDGSAGAVSQIIYLGTENINTFEDDAATPPPGCQLFICSLW